MAALFDRRGFDPDFWAWVLPHAVPEVLALCIAAAAGLSMGLALVDPRGRPRKEALMNAGRRSATLIGMALLLLFYAALIEGYFRQFSIGIAPRFLLALFNLALLSAYLFIAGRGREALTADSQGVALGSSRRAPRERTRVHTR
jgi:uncharacterized membrane protein SpoIIM required for sporulation